MPRLERTFATRGYEIGPTGTLPLAVLARYFEHLRWESASDPTVDVAKLFRGGLRMVVRAQQIVVNRPLGVAEPLRVSMWIGRIGRSSMDLWHEATREGDHAWAARGIVTGVYLGTDNRPHRIPEDFHSVVDPAGSSTLIPPVPSRAPSDAWTHEVRVRPSDLDLFNHVNHANYAAYYEDARVLAARAGAYGPRSSVGTQPARGISMDYRREALLDQELEIATWALDDDPLSFGFELRRKDDGELLSTARIAVTPS